MITELCNIKFVISSMKHRKVYVAAETMVVMQVYEYMYAAIFSLSFLSFHMSIVSFSVDSKTNLFHNLCYYFPSKRFIITFDTLCLMFLQLFTVKFCFN